MDLHGVNCGNLHREYVGYTIISCDENCCNGHWFTMLHGTSRCFPKVFYYVFSMVEDIRCIRNKLNRLVLRDYNPMTIRLSQDKFLSLVDTAPKAPARDVFSSSLLP